MIKFKKSTKPYFSDKLTDLLILKIMFNYYWILINKMYIWSVVEILLWKRNTTVCLFIG